MFGSLATPLQDIAEAKHDLALQACGPGTGVIRDGRCKLSTCIEMAGCQEGYLKPARPGNCRLGSCRQKCALGPKVVLQSQTRKKKQRLRFFLSLEWLPIEGRWHFSNGSQRLIQRCTKCSGADQDKKNERKGSWRDPCRPRPVQVLCKWHAARYHADINEEVDFD